MTTFPTNSPNSHNEQPGKVFNKSCSSFDLDTFFQQQQRRKLHERSAYHVDDLSSMMVPPSDASYNKSLGGSLGYSPVCVQDIKQFEPLHYEDPCINDAGGVAIDLCLHQNSNHSLESDDLNSYSTTSDIDEDDDDLLLGLELDSEPQPQHHLQHHQSLRQPLAPILEDRKVTFAAKHVVLKVGDADSCAIDQRFVHQVFDAVQVWFIPHHTEYADDERNSMWYSPEQMASMKEDAIQAKLAKRQAKNSIRNTTAQVCESELIKCSFAPLAVLRGKRTLPSIGYSNQGMDSEQQPQQAENCHYSRRCRYEDMIDAVLLEQYEQRLMCFRVYGRVDPNCSGIIDFDRLAEVYSIVGDTQRAHERAVEKAKKFVCEEDQNEDNSVVSSSSSVSSSDNSKNEQGSPKTSTVAPNAMKRSPSFNEKMAFETSLCLDRGVSSLFEVLLTPFIEIRSGDLFLGVGEEMSITTQ